MVIMPILREYLSEIVGYMFNYLMTWVKSLGSKAWERSIELMSFEEEEAVAAAAAEEAEEAE